MGGWVGGWVGGRAGRQAGRQAGMVGGVLAGLQVACPAGALTTPDRLADPPALPALLQEAAPRVPRAEADQHALSSEAAAAEAKRRAEHEKKQARYASLFEGRSSGGRDQTGVPEDLAFAQLKAKVGMGGGHLGRQAGGLLGRDRLAGSSDRGRSTLRRRCMQLPLPAGCPPCSRMPACLPAPVLRLPCPAGGAADAAAGGRRGLDS